MKVYVYNPQNNRCRAIKWGVSWVYLFFGGWALLFQGRWLFILIEFALTALIKITSDDLSKLIAFVLASYHIFLFLFGNKMYVRYLLGKGWLPSDESSKRILS